MQREFTLLDHHVIVSTDQPAWLERLDDIVVRADDPQPIRHTLRLELTQGAGCIQIAHAGRVCAQAEDLDLAIRALHLQINHLVLEPQKEILKFHAAAGTWQDRFFMVTGDRGAGKTTLLLKMMFAGAEAHCDETVLLRDGLLQTFPRKFYVKTGTLKCLSQAAPVCAKKRAYPGFFGKQLFFADPTDFGLPWRNREDRPWAIFHLTPAFDQAPAVQRCSKVDMVKHLMLQTINLAGDLGQHVAQVCQLASNCHCYSLRVGNLDATAALLKNILA